MSEIGRITRKCESEIGPEIWHGSFPRYVFKDGPLYPKCNFETILEVKATGQKINHIKPAIGKLSQLRSLNLSYNSISKLPVEITKLKLYTTMDISKNPVWKKLDWSHKSLRTYPIILNYFTKLEFLDLGYNKIEEIPPFVSKLSSLQQLILTNNSVHKDGLSINVILLSMLKDRTGLNISNNPVAKSLNWHSVKDSTGALKILRCFPHSKMKNLDISGNQESRGNFQRMDVIEVFKLFPGLDYLNVSFNKLNSVEFNISFATMDISILDISDNPVTDVPFAFFYNANHIWERGYVNMKNLADFSFFANLEEYPAVADKFPAAFVGNYFQYNDLLNVWFIGSGSENFPICQLRKSKVQSINVHRTFNLSLNCMNEFFNVELFNIDGKYKRNIVNSVPNDIGNLNKLKFLDMDSCGLTRIPTILPPKLEDIDFGYNKIDLLPSNFMKLSLLKKLDLHDNLLVYDYLSFSLHTSLSVLHIQGNNIKNLNLTGLKKLEELEAYRTGLNNIEGLCNLDGLVHLEISMNNFKTLPSCLSTLTKLSFLNIAENDVLIRNLTQLTNLEVLNVKDTKIKFIPGLHLLKKLQVLNVARNTNFMLPSLNILSGLQELNIAETNQVSLFQLQKLRSLKKLHAYNNKLSYINISGLESLEMLDVPRNKLSDLSELPRLTRLEHLDLNYNEFKILPSISNLKRLKILILGNNPLIRLPFHRFSTFQELEHLTLTNLNLSVLPTDLSKVANLRRFHASNNRLSRFPGVSALKRLEVIDLDNNLIENVDGLANMIHVEFVYLRKNNIKYLPPLHRLKKILCLNLRENLLTELPAIEKLVNLEVLDLRRNKLSGTFTGYENLTNLQFLGLGNQSGGLKYNVSRILEKLPQLSYYGDHFRADRDRYQYYGQYYYPAVAWRYKRYSTSGGYWSSCGADINI